MSQSARLIAAINVIMAESDSVNVGITFPKAKDVVIARIKAINPGYPQALLDLIDEGSQAVNMVKVEIANAKTNLKLLIGQIPFLATPITAALAINTIISLLPVILEALEALGILLPEEFIVVLEGVAIAKTLLTTAGAPLVGPLAPLKSILGL